MKNKAKIGLFSWLNSVTGTKISFRFDFGVLLKVTYGLENCLPDICSQSGNKTLFSPGHLSTTAWPQNMEISDSWVVQGYWKEYIKWP